MQFSDHTESPVVMRKMEKGNFGYVRDVNAEVETTTAVLTMLGLLNRPKTADTAIELAKVQQVSVESVVADESKESKALAGKAKVQPSPELLRAESGVSAVDETSFRPLPVGRTRRPFVMVLSFGSEKFFAGVQSDLLELLRSKLEVLHGLSNERVDELIGSQDLVGILITDARIADTKNAYILFRLVAFAKAGGTVVLGGSFSSGIRFDEMRPFFANVGTYPGEAGITRAARSRSAIKMSSSSPLASPLHMKGLFLVGGLPETAVYVPIRVGAGDVLHVPIALIRVGKRKLGYIGYAGLQDEHSQIVFAMFGLTN